MAYTLDQAASLLHVGRNTMTKILRKKGVFDAVNKPQGRFSGAGFFVLKERSWYHPEHGSQWYSKTLVTEEGLALIKRVIEKNRSEAMEKLNPVNKSGDALKSVSMLLKLVRMNCGSSDVAANVLLSTYNIYDYKLDIRGLCSLDADYYDAAIQVINLRCRNGIEPHTLLANGDDVFKQLVHDWPSLRNETIH